MTDIATTIRRNGRRVWIPSAQLRAIGFDDIDIGALDEVESANATARRLFQAAGRALRQRRELHAA